jgi:Xaa-Pro dipeptidase
MTHPCFTVTRTMPVGNGGKFTPEAKAIYTLVHEMQRLSFEAIRPGLHWDAIQLICHQALVRGFQKLGIFKSPNSPGSGSWNSEEAIIASGISAAFFPHGVGHSLGMDVHDVPSASKPLVNPTIQKGQGLGHPDFYTYLRLRLPLEVGMVVVSNLSPIVVTVEEWSIGVLHLHKLDRRAGYLLLTPFVGASSGVQTH